jgi:hypothetical protein
MASRSSRRTAKSDPSPASTVRRVHTLADLSPDPRNANEGTTRGREALTASLKAYGAGRSILIDRHGRIVAGNKTVEQARALGLRLQVVPTDGASLVAVQRTDLDLETDARARALAVADNRVAELDLQWDPAMLGQLQADGLDLGAFWTDGELQRLVGTLGAPDPAADQVLAPGPTTIQRGDLFALGPHRLLCGDATDAGDVARLLGDIVPAVMATDAPYGVDYDPVQRHRAYPRQRTAIGRVMNDTQAAWPAAFRLYPGDVIYAWHASAIRSAETSDRSRDAARR